MLRTNKKKARLTELGPRRRTSEAILNDIVLQKEERMVERELNDVGRRLRIWLMLQLI
jgi:hypothetical protein